MQFGLEKRNMNIKQLEHIISRSCSGRLEMCLLENVSKSKTKNQVFSGVRVP